MGGTLWRKRMTRGPCRVVVVVDVDAVYALAKGVFGRVCVCAKSESNWRGKLVSLTHGSHGSCQVVRCNADAVWCVCHGWQLSAYGKAARAEVHAQRYTSCAPIVCVALCASGKIRVVVVQQPMHVVLHVLLVTCFMLAAWLGCLQ